MRRVAEAHGSQEVEPGISMEQALQSPALRANAGRWRGGTETRRVTALLARLMNGLQSIKPSWLDGSRPGGPSLVEALPLRPSRVEAPVTSSWSGGLMRMVWQRVCMNWWRTLLLTLVILCFPKLTAMVITLVLRLAISFVKALLWQILAEVGKELKTLCLQMSQASSSFEFMVVEALEGLFWWTGRVCGNATFLDNSNSTSCCFNYTWWGESPTPPPLSLDELFASFGRHLSPYQAHGGGGIMNLCAFLFDLTGSFWF